MLSSALAPGSDTASASDAALGKLLVIQSSRSTFLAPVLSCWSSSAAGVAAGVAADVAAGLAAATLADAGSSGLPGLLSELDPAIFFHVLSEHR